MDLQHIGSRFTLQANISAPFVVPDGHSGFKRGFKMVFNKHKMRSFEAEGAIPHHRTRQLLTDNT